MGDVTLYKVLRSSEWDNACATGVFLGSGIDLTDGFIHLSARSQVVETVQRHFAGQDDLLLLSVMSNPLGESLRWEASRDGALFPHVYGEIPIGAVLSVDELVLGDDGVHRFPDSF